LQTNDSERTVTSVRIEATKPQSRYSKNILSALSYRGKKVIAIGQQRILVNAVTSKIQDDITFLEDRIRRMEKMKAPSETILNTYRAMLSSRQSVLKWLEEHEMISSRQNDTKKTGS